LVTKKKELSGQNGNRNSKRKILAVDDDPDITLIVKAGLEACGLFEVHTFNDPELALSSFKPELYDLALLDISCMVNSIKTTEEVILSISTKLSDNSNQNCFNICSGCFSSLLPAMIAAFIPPIDVPATISVCMLLFASDLNT
jgi:response regulator RpfG family c-di-GMP phosphodiesterase